MIPLTLLSLVAIAFLAFFGSEALAHYRARGVHAERLTPVDLDAFENLTDPDEEQFLRAHLSRVEFRGVQRTRIRAAITYVAVLSKNAGVLMSAGQSARTHPDPEIAEAGLEIIQRSIRLKVWCLLAMVRLNAATMFPTILSPSGRIADQYLLVTYLAANLPRKIAA